MPRVPLADCLAPSLSSTSHVLSAAWNPRDLEDTSCQFSVLSDPVTVHGELKGGDVKDPGAGNLRVLSRIVPDAGARTKAFLWGSSGPEQPSRCGHCCPVPLFLTWGRPFHCKLLHCKPRGTPSLGNKGGWKQIAIDTGALGFGSEAPPAEINLRIWTVFLRVTSLLTHECLEASGPVLVSKGE